MGMDGEKTDQLLKNPNKRVSAVPAMDVGKKNSSP
jgi:hypothetical protein